MSDWCPSGLKSVASSSEASTNLDRRYSPTSYLWDSRRPSCRYFSTDPRVTEGWRSPPQVRQTPLIGIRLYFAEQSLHLNRCDVYAFVLPIMSGRRWVRRTDLTTSCGFTALIFSAISICLSSFSVRVTRVE